MSTSHLLDPFYYSDSAMAIATSSASLSAISSATVVVVICRSQVKLSSVYNRIIFATSVCDLIGSISIAFTTLLMPVDQIYPFNHAHGTVSTCEAQGFLITFFSGCCLLYSGGLSLFHLCLINLKMSDKMIRNILEPAIHVLSLSLPFCFCVSDPYS